MPNRDTETITDINDGDLFASIGCEPAFVRRDTLMLFR
jgi:hypothetical protein